VEPLDEPIPEAEPTDVAAPDHPDGDVEGPAERRRYPSTIGGAFYLLVLAASIAGLVIVVHGNWRLGVKWISASLVFGGFIRLVLPARDGGMLAVRRRLVDVGLLVVVGVALWFLSVNIPNQPL
jgi:hypothetical protein